MDTLKEKITDRKLSGTKKERAPVKYVTTVYAKETTFLFKILFRWRGSVWQKLFIDAFIFVILWVVINVTYAVYLHNDDHKDYLKVFKSVVLHVKKIASGVALTMVLGFFVTTVFNRWWDIATTIPKTNCAVFALRATSFQDETTGDRIRNTILRYLNLSWIMAMRHMCPQICRRFKKKDAKGGTLKRWSNQVRGEAYMYREEESGWITMINEDKDVKDIVGPDLIMVEEDEIKALQKFYPDTNEAKGKNTKRPKHDDTNDYLLPLDWASQLLINAYKHKLLQTEGAYESILKTVHDFRVSLEKLMTHNEIHIPLVYTQIVVIAVYSYCFAELFTTHQSIGTRFSLLSTDNMTVTEVAKTYIKHYIETDGRYLPIYSIFKFIFYMGWFKTALALLNPLGNDPEALPVSAMLNQNLRICFKMMNKQDFSPKWLSDWIKKLPEKKPYPNSDENSHKLRAKLRYSAYCIDPMV